MSGCCATGCSVTDDGVDSSGGENDIAVVGVGVVMVVATGC